MAMNNRNLTALLIEDDSDYAFLIEEVIMEHGIDAVHVDRLSSALSRLSESQFDVILLDLGLPDAGLNPVWQDVREQDSTTPIIVLTGRDDDELAAHAIRTGAQDYLIKTENLGSDLVRAITYAIERQRVHLELEEAHQKAMEATANAIRLAETQADMARLGRSLTQSLQLETLLTASAPIIHQLLPAHRIILNLADVDAGTFFTRVLHGESIPSLPTDQRPLPGSVTEFVMQRRKPLVIAEQLQLPPEERLVPLDHLANLGIYSGLVVPLIAGDGAVGTIVWLGGESDIFSDRDLDIAVTVSVQVAGALANAELHKKTLRLEKEQTERVRLEFENRKLEAANEVTSAVISNVSHELRTPLTSVLAFADILRKNKRGVFDEQELLQIRMIRHSGRQLDLLISDLLTMSRLEQGEFKMSYAEFELNDLIDEVITVMSSIASVRNQTISAICKQDAIPVVADRSRLYQVICNLVSNASKYSTDGSTVEIEYESDGEEVSIAVRDFGEGMSTEEQAEIFERFARLDNDVTRTQQGTGLGLHIVKSLVDLHNGTIEVESYEGMGSVFTVKIPSKPGQELQNAVA